jgi:hypothetical protein
VHRDGHAVTDWFEVKTRPTIKLPPGKYKLEPGFATGRMLKHWEITTHGLFSDQTLVQFERAPELEVARGERVTVRSVMRDAPVGERKPEPAAFPDPAVVQALRDLVVAKEGARDKAVARFAAASRMEVLGTEIDLTEARIRLAEAERNKDGVCTLLEELVTQRQEAQRLTKAQVEAGYVAPSVLKDVYARVADARARLAQARSQ